MLTPPPNGPTADGSRVLARSRQKTTKQETNKNQQTKKIQKTKKKPTKPKKPKKPKKNKKKTSFPKLWGWGLQKMVFLVFSRKRWFFWFETIFFSRKRWFLSSRSSKKPSLSREKDGFWRSCPGKTIFFSRKRWFYQDKTSKNHLFSRKRWFFKDKISKNHLFLEKKSGCSKTIFEPKKPSFSRENQKKNIFWRPQPHSFGKDGFFVFFVFFVFFGFFGFLEKKMVKF